MNRPLFVRLLAPFVVLLASCDVESPPVGGVADTAARDAGDAKLVFADGEVTDAAGGSRADAASPGGAGGHAGGSAGAGGALPGGTGGTGGTGGAVKPDAASGGAGGQGGTSDAAVTPPDQGPAPDQGPPPPPAGDCQPCQGADDCAGLAPAGECSMLFGGSFCTRGCAGEGPCPDGFRCLFDRCVPAGARCDGCATDGCAADQRCNLDNGFCEARQGRCQGCNVDNDCEAGLACRPLGFGRACLADCGAGGDCPEGYQCTDGACTPSQGFCDPCGGCAAPTPVCNVITRMCQECGIGTPCPEGLVCEMDGHCAQPEPGVECRGDLDCRDPGRPFCIESACLGCRGQHDCRAGQVCDAGACVDQPCGGIACQAGSACDPVTARCSPGCAADADCGGDDLRCNAATGQCYQADQRCDPTGQRSVCGPGAECVADPLDANRRVCTCAFTDPSNFQEPNEDHRIPCHPEGICVQLGGPPGACIARQ